MDQTTAINHGVLLGQRGGPVAQAALAIFAISLATLLGAWFFQFVLGYPPCPLCLQQRIPYYIVIPLALILALAARGGVSPRLVAAGLAVILIAVLCGAALGTYHAWRRVAFATGRVRPTAPVRSATSAAADRCSTSSSRSTWCAATRRPGVFSAFRSPAITC